MLSTRFLLQVGKGGKEEGREAERSRAGGSGAGGGWGQGGTEERLAPKTAKSEGVEEAKADKSGKIIAKRSARSVFAVIISEKAACIVVHGVVGNNA